MSCSRTAADDPGDPRGTGGCTRGTGACTKPFPSAVLSHAYGAPRRGDEHCSLAALRTGTFRQRPRWSCPASYRSSDHSPKGGFPPERAEGSSGSPTRSARLWRENSVSSSASLTDRDLRALVGLLDDGRRDDAGPAMPKNCGSVRPAHRPMRPRWRVFGPQGGVKYLLDGDIHSSGRTSCSRRTSRRPTGDAKRRLSRAPRLTPREWQVLDLVAQGHSNAEIAGTLVTSVSTVRKHPENILARIGVHSRSAAVAPMMPPAATGPVRSRPAPRPTSFGQPSGSEIRSAGR